MIKERTKYRTLDELDRNIITELEKTANEKVCTLACRLNVGERTLRRRINNMIRDDIIRIVALPNFPLLGYRAWSFIGIQVAPGYNDAVSRWLVSHPRIYFVAYVLGRFDIIIAVDYKTSDGLMYFLTSELMRVRGIRGTESMMLVNPSKYYNFRWSTPKFKDDQDGGEHYIDIDNTNDIYELDEEDSKILGALRQDGLARPAGLKSKLGISESKIRNRMKSMQEHGVFQKLAVSNPEIIEYELWAMIGINVNDRFSQKTVMTLIDNPFVYLASYSIGRFNFIVEARFRSISLLEHFVSIELPEIQGVDSVETFLNVAHLKYNNINWYRFEPSTRRRLKEVANKI